MQNVCNSKMFRPRCFLASSTPALNFFSRCFFLLPDDLKTIFSSCFTFPQVTLLFKHWNEFGDVIIEYGTMKSPQCKRVFLCLSKRFLIYEHIYIYVYMYTYKYKYVYSSDSIVMVSCIFSSLVVSKSARECHFLCQVIKKPPLPQ